MTIGLLASTADVARSELLGGLLISPVFGGAVVERGTEVSESTPSGCFGVAMALPDSDCDVMGIRFASCCWLAEESPVLIALGVAA